MKTIKKILILVIILLWGYNISYGAEITLTSLPASAYSTTTNCIAIYWDNTNWVQWTNWTFVCWYNYNVVGYVTTYSYDWSVIQTTTLNNTAQSTNKMNFNFFTLWDWKGIITVKNSTSASNSNIYAWFYNKWIISNFNLIGNDSQYGSFNYSFDDSEICLFRAGNTTVYCYQAINWALITRTNTEFNSLYTNSFVLQSWNVQNRVNRYFYRSFTADTHIRYITTNTDNSFIELYKINKQLVSNPVTFSNFDYLKVFNFYFSFWNIWNYVFDYTNYFQNIGLTGSTFEYLSGSTAIFSSGWISASTINQKIEKLYFMYNWQYASSYLKGDTTTPSPYIYGNFAQPEVMGGTYTGSTTTWWGWTTTPPSWTGWSIWTWTTWTWIINFIVTLWTAKVYSSGAWCTPVNWSWVFDYIDNYGSISLTTNRNYQVIDDWTFTILTIDLGRWLSDTINWIAIWFVNIFTSFFSLIIDDIINPLVGGYVEFIGWEEYCFLTDNYTIPVRPTTFIISGGNVDNTTAMDYILIIFFTVIIIFLIFKKW